MIVGRLVRVAAVLTALAVIAAALSSHTLGTGALQLAPALLLFGALLARRYPGERRVIRLIGRARRGRRVRVALLRATPRPASGIVRGGLLLAAGLAERGPPGAPIAA